MDEEHTAFHLFGSVLFIPIKVINFINFNTDDV